MIRQILVCALAVFSLNAMAATTDEIVKQTMNGYMEENDIPGAAVIVYVKGKPHSYYFGYANREKKKPVTDKTIFEVGSLSKLMTSLLLAENLDFARVQLDDPVTKYIPKLSEPFTYMSLRSLATHTSGLPLQPPKNVKTKEQWLNYAKNFKPEFDAEDEYQYSNIGMGLLGDVLEKANHKPLNTLYRKKVLSRLGMQEIGLSVPKKLQKYVATGYNSDGEPTQAIDDGLFPAAYGLKVSVSDMNKFLQAAIGIKTPDSIFYPMRMTQTPYAKFGQYKQGLGWQIHDLHSSAVSWLMRGGDNIGLNAAPVDEMIAEPTFDGDSLIDKTGMTDGFRAYIAVIPNKKTGIVVLTNRRMADASIKTTARKILFKLNNMA